MMHVIKPSIILFVTALIVTALISLAHTITEEPIAEQRWRKQDAAMKQVLPQADEFHVMIGSQYTGSIVGLYSATKDGEDIGWVVELAPEGYSGKINMMVGISITDEIITGMRILSHTETPGLGALAVKENFYRLYDNRKLTPLSVVKSSPGDDDIQAMTSATITTVAITDAVNEAIEWYNGMEAAE